MYDEHNVFARILRGEIPASKVYEDDAVLAFRDIAPAAPTHIIVIPKEKYVSFADFASQAGKEIISNFFSTVEEIAEELGLADTGYRIITNHGPDAHQTIPHFHVHILGGKMLGPLIAGDNARR